MNIISPLIRSVENPKPSLSNPANWLIERLGGFSVSGQNVTPQTAVGLPAVWRAVDVLSNSIASLPFQVFSQVGDVETLNREHPVYPLIHTKPNQNMTTFQWRKLEMVHVLLWGNGYSRIMFDQSMRPGELLPVHPQDIRVELMDGKLWYIQNGEETVDGSQMLHFKGMGWNGITGKSVIAVQRENLGLALAAQEFGAEYYAKGAKLDGVIQTPNVLNTDGLKNLRESWNTTYSQRGGERVAILDNGMEYKNIGIPPDDSQFIETRKFSVTDVARMFSVPPPLLYDLERATFSNISELILSFTKFSLMPWIINIEQEVNDKLFFESEKGNTFASLNVEGLLRGDIKERSEFYKTLHMLGSISANEIRKKENMNPVDGGDKYFVAANMIDVKQPNRQNETQNTI